MHRCWLGEIEPLTCNSIVHLSPEESCHVAKVLRMKKGETVQLIAAEKLYQGEIAEISTQETSVIVKRELQSPEMTIHISLIQGLPKQDKLEMIIQKSTELGVWNILPVEMERSVSKIDSKISKKQDRWSRIALEAAKQSGRAHVPVVLQTCKLNKAESQIRALDLDLLIIAWEEEGKQKLTNVCKDFLSLAKQDAKIGLLIGPEGGISPSEIEHMKSICNVQCVTLGQRILRTETAGICAISALLACLGEI